jgi:large subunit ribosomal protein L17
MYKLIKKNKLQGKTHAHRKSLVKSLIIELIRAEKIKTTKPRARAIKSGFDKLVTMAKKNTDASKRNIESFFAMNERAVNRFYHVVSEKLNDRSSGYTRVIHTLPRKGDNAPQVFVMLVNYEPKTSKSTVQKLLEKRKVSEEKKSVKGRIKKAIGVKDKKKKTEE